MAKLFVFTAPSGAGKTTIVKHLLGKYKQLAFSISATTRPQRTHETAGKDYYFLSPDAFRQKIDAEEFVEWEEVYPDRFYGTLKSEVERLWEADKHIVFDIDVKGAMSIKKHYPDDAITIFVKPPSINALVERLKKRDTEDESSLKTRIARMKEELAYEKEFDRILINDILEQALDDAEKLIESYL